MIKASLPITLMDKAKGLISSNLRRPNKKYKPIFVTLPLKHIFLEWESSVVTRKFADLDVDGAKSLVTNHYLALLDRISNWVAN